MVKNVSIFKIGAFARTINYKISQLNNKTLDYVAKSH